jgi:muramoyltetrapeptide carboxypeptidase
MNRKDFLSQTIPLSLAVIPITRGLSNQPQTTDACQAKGMEKQQTIPPYLKKGDTIGICCPSGPISLEEIKSAVQKMKDWGFEVLIGKTVGMKEFTYAGPDQERIKDLQLMLDDPKIKAIMFGRGGYGAVRIIDKLDFKKFAANPKWIIGFSDATVFHSHLNKNYGIASIHSKMCNSFPDDWTTAEPDQIQSIESIRKCLMNEPIDYPVPLSLYNCEGIAEGELVGGNLAILQNLAGTVSDIDTRDKILFIEDAEEYLYNLDRMMWNLHRTGKLSNLKGLIVGGFTHIRHDDPGEEFGKTIYQIVLEKVKDYNYPVCFDFPVGHQKANYALKCGVKHTLSVITNRVSLTQSPKS